MPELLECRLAVGRMYMSNEISHDSEFPEELMIRLSIAVMEHCS